MVNFGGNSKKKASTAKEVAAFKSGDILTSSPTMKSHTASPPKSGGGFFRKALGTPVKNPKGPTPTTPSTPPVTTPDSSSKIAKERPTVDTIDIPLQSQILTTPNSKAMRDNTSLLDSPNMYRIDSALSDLSGSQLPATTGVATDPPALILRTSSIEAASGSSGYVNNNSVKEIKPAASNVVTASSTAESIVTKVLGIVDISCVSSGLVPSTPTRTIAPASTITQPNKDASLKPTYSFQPEWGVAPEDEDGTIPGPTSFGSGGTVSDQSKASNNTPTNNNGSTIKRELAEIAARASAPSTLQFDHDFMATEVEIGSKNYRRYHETFELVYTEPTGKKSKKVSTSRDGPMTESRNDSKSMPNSASNARSNKGLRINRWVANQWKIKKQVEKTDVPQNSVSAPRVAESTEPLGIMAQGEIVARNDRYSTPELLSEPNGNNKKLTSAVTAETTTTSTTFATPPTDASRISNNCFTVVENIEATKGAGVNSSDINTTVVVTATSADSSINVTTLRDEPKDGKGSNKGWYRFNNKVDSGKTKKEKKMVGFDSTIGEPKAITRTSPNKKKGLKTKGMRNKDKTNDIELQSNPTKIVLKSIKCSTNGLETVNEEDYVDDNTELKVRVPGFQNEDSYLSDHDLIGSEIVEEIYMTLNKSIEQEEKDKSDDELVVAQVNESPADEGNKQRLLEQKLIEEVPNISSNSILLPSTTVKTTSDGYQEYRDVDTSPVVSTDCAVSTQQPKPKSWKERFGLKKSEVESGPGAVTVLPKSDRAKPNGAVVPKNTDKSKSKPQWKAAIDPATGKTYYYHKKTRETTWTKPPDFDIAPPKTTTAVTPAKEADDCDEIDQAMQSNASPKNTDMEAATALDIVDIPSEEKNESVDRMMRDITATEEANADDEHQDHEGDDNEDDEFPSTFNDLTAAIPFDEPRGETEYPDDERKDEKSMTTARTRTTTSIYSGFSSRFSTKSRISEVTQPIKNLSSNKPNIDASHASISTKHDDIPTVGQSVHRNRRPARIPKNIPVPRLRELNVEEFTTRDRDFKARTSRLSKLPYPVGEYDGVLPMYALSNSNGNGISETDDADADRSTVSYAATDSISALSEADLSFVDRKEAYDDARRRALDRAIAQEDWDLAAKLSESMRKTMKTANTRNRPFPSEWVQSEMDRFISENDWDAVASYIAHVRANANEASQKQVLNHLAADPRSNPGVTPNQVLQNRGAGGFVRNLQSNSSDVSGTSNPQKIFGARSQLQHRDLHSVDSHSSYSTTFDSEYTSESYEQRSEEERPPAPINRTRQQEFAC